MNDDDFDDEGGFFRRNRILLSVMAILFIGGIFAATHLSSGRSSSPPKIENLTRIVNVPPLPPPPPQHLPEPPPQEQKMVEQTPVNEPEQKPDPVPKDEPPALLGTNVAGKGNDGFGLGHSGNGGGSGVGGSGGRKGSKWGWYAGAVQSRIQGKLRDNPHTREAAMQTVEVRIWPDETGRVTRAVLSGTTGDKDVDAALKNEVLTGLQLEGPPPSDMPRPIVLRLSAKRPN